MIFGYIRISSKDQHMDRQRKQLHEFGCCSIYEEIISGIEKERPILQVLLQQLLPHDVVVVTELSRMVRSLQDLLQMLEIFEKNRFTLFLLKSTLIQGMLIHIVG